MRDAAREMGSGQQVGRILATVPFYALLLAAYPILRLYSDNVSEVVLSDVLIPLVIAIAAAGSVLLVLARVWGDARRAAILTAALTVPFLTFRLFADALQVVWPYEITLRATLITLLAWVALIMLALYVALRSRRLAALTQGLNVVAIVLVSLTLIAIASHALASSRSAAHASSQNGPVAAMSIAEGGSEPMRRDIYHIVFDRYGSDLALLLGRGIDNRPFTDWLRDRGFHVVQDARANYQRTVLSLSAVHSMSLHDELANRMGPANPDFSPLYRQIRNSAAASFLQRHGYRYYHLGSWFHHTSTSDIADEVVRPSFVVDFASTLVDQSAISALDELAHVFDYHVGTRYATVTQHQLDRLETITSEPGPKYVFAHVLLPHEPYLFMEDGRVDRDRATFATQLAYANRRVRDLIDPLLALPPEDRPIIILQADEGPWPTGYGGPWGSFDWLEATDEQLVVKFGALHAMYLPGPEGADPVPEGTTVANTFPEILERYFGVAMPRLPDRTYANGDGGPYDLVDITAALDAATVRLSAAPQAAIFATDRPAAPPTAVALDDEPVSQPGG